MTDKRQQQQQHSRLRLQAQRKAELWVELQPWKNEWQQISKRMAPRHGRFFLQDRNRPRTQTTTDILDNTAVSAVETMANGMMSLAFSPARRWYRGTLSDKELARWQPVAEWLAKTDDAIGQVLTSSNFYRVTHEGFRTLGPFGINAAMLAPHATRGMWIYPFEVGEYAIACNTEGQVDTCYREFALTTAQMVDQFGWDAVSDAVKVAWNRGNLGHWHTVIHAIEPRKHRVSGSLAAKDMPYSSCYWEQARESEDFYLHEGGFEDFPLVVPRWSVAQGDAYGYGPGAYALGDVGSLNHLAYRHAQVVDYGTEPPLQMPPSQSSDEVSFLPGGITIVDQPGTQPIKPIWQPTVSLADLQADRADTRQRINRAFYVDMFLMLSNISDTTQRTAAEIAKRAEEQLVQAGPVVQRINLEYGEPVLKFAFQQAQRLGMIPPPPEELQGQRWQVEFESVFTQAQRLIGTANNDRFLQSVGPLVQVDPAVMDVLNAEEIVRDYAERYSVRPRLLRSEREVARRAAARAAEIRAQQQTAMAEQQASMVNKLANAPATGGTALDTMSQLVGYNSPPAQSY
jgi:hypothetical protein